VHGCKKIAGAQDIVIGDLASIAETKFIADQVNKLSAVSIFASYLEGFLKQLGKRNVHGRKTNQNRARSMSPAFRHTFAPFYRHGL
jgi:hypothetical protein